MKQEPLKMAVVGAGLVGTLLAIYLKKARYKKNTIFRKIH